ncbi:MAG: transglutaminase-like domain-containing protein, partial [Planctomycetota bacterium]
MRQEDDDGWRLESAVLNIRGKKEECLCVEVKNVETGAFHKQYYRPDGLLVCVVQDTETLTLSSRKEILRIREAIENGEIDLPYREAGMGSADVGLNLYGAFNLMTLIVDVTIPLRPGIPEPKFDGGNFQDVISRKKVGNKIVTRLRLKAFDKDVNTPYPVKVEGMERYLEATVLMQVDDPIVKAAARNAVGDAKDARTAALRISEFVNATIRSGTGSIGQYSALEILQNGRGDCSEHALLFETLCRAAGIPARQASGYVSLGQSWGNHAWSEIWVGDWIGADACTNDIGTRARYVFFGYPDEPHSRAGVVSQAFTGYAKIDLIEGTFGDGQPVDLTGKEALYGEREDGTAFDYNAGIGTGYFGLHLRPARPLVSPPRALRATRQLLPRGHDPGLQGGGIGKPLGRLPSNAGLFRTADDQLQLQPPRRAESESAGVGRDHDVPRPVR